MLKEIIAHKRKEIRKQKKHYPLELIKEHIFYFPTPRDFKKALQGQPGEVKIIAEIKKASPSHGAINSAFLTNNCVADIARIYEKAGAAAISVLTENKYFDGCVDDLKEAKRVTGLPVLRKDFIVDEYQVYESRAMGADAVLLIASRLSFPKLERLINLVHELNMVALVEVGDEKDLKVARRAGAEIIGINNRDLETMQIDLRRTVNLAKAVPPGTVLVSESGINTREQVRMLYEKAGISAVLVGKSLVSADDPSVKIRELVEGEFKRCPSV